MSKQLIKFKGVYLDENYQPTSDEMEFNLDANNLEYAVKTNPNNTKDVFALHSSPSKISVIKVTTGRAKFIDKLKDAGAVFF